MNRTEDDGFDHIARLGVILSETHQAAGYEHVLILLIRELEAAAVHVPPDGSAWYGTTRDSEALADMKRLVGGIATDDEQDTTALAPAFDPSAESLPANEFFSGMLWSLAEPLGCEHAVLLARDAGDAPAWLAARLEGDQVRFMETQPDAFNRDLLRLHDFTTESVDGSPIPKASLRAADVGAAYSAQMSPAAKELIERQEEAFRLKFGREMGPGDPVFFDPAADTPQPFSPEAIKDMEAQMAEVGFDEEWFIRRQAEAEEKGLLNRAGRKVGRNDPCWCGSGKKFKRCHGT